MTRHFWALFLVISGFSSPATSQDAPVQAESPKVVSGPAPYNIDLDAASGEYEERFLEVSSGAFTVRGFIQFVTIRANPKWAPVANVELRGPKGPFFAGLSAFVQSKAPDKIEFAVLDERLRGLPDASFARVHVTDQAIPFEVRLDRSGALQVSVAGRPGRTVFVRPFEITRVRFFGSTAHIRFLNVDVVPSDR